MLYDLIDASGNTLRSGFKLRPTTPPLEPGQQWVEHVPKPKPPEVPEIVSRFQGRAALLQAGILDDIETYMLTADPFEREAWNSITEMRRNSPMTIRLGALFGLTSDMMDDLFRFAATIYA